MADNEDVEGAIWSADLLDRRSDAEFLLRFLLGRLEERSARGASRSYVINVDAGWGQGKTFFLERFAQMLNARGYIVASVNAWKDDHAEDPLLAVMAAIDEAVAPIVGKQQTAKRSWQGIKRTGAAVIVAGAKGASLHWMRKALGEGADAILGELDLGSKDTAKASAKAMELEIEGIVDQRAKSLLDSFKKAQRSIQTFREELRGFLEIVEKQKTQVPMFVLVDELDRCRPLFAIALLERIKHLFDIDNMVFIIATNTNQLRHSIGAVYGANFEAGRYLSRFFDRTYFFEEPTLEQFVETLIARAPFPDETISLPPAQKLGPYLAGAFRFFGLSLRDVEQCLDILHSVVTVWDGRVPLEFVVLVPLAVGHQQNIELTLESGFDQELKSLVQRNKGRTSVWEVPFVEVLRFGEQDIETLSGLALYINFVKWASRPLPDTFSADSLSKIWDRWIVERLQREFAVVHGNSYNTGNPPRSMVTSYPELVRSAGRLVASVTSSPSR